MPCKEEEGNSQPSPRRLPKADEQQIPEKQAQIEKYSLSLFV
jgi:hypothetical protein